MIAIMAPHGKSALQLSRKESNPENLKLTPADVLSSVGQNDAKKEIIAQALKGQDKVRTTRAVDLRSKSNSFRDVARGSQEDNQLIDKYLKMADIDQVKPVPATIRPLPLASLNSLAAVQKSLGEDRQAAAAAAADTRQPSSAVAPGPVPRAPSPPQVESPPPAAARAEPAAEDGGSARQPLSARAPPALQGALESLPAADLGEGADSAPAAGAAAERTDAVEPAEAGSSQLQAAGGGGGARGEGGGAKSGVVGVLLHDIAQDLGF
jgi:hypothetical protein